ncbi:MAG: TadE-like protein [Hyphomicrobiales bacterium]|nr:TadE-like protein [Hyphomicrobiales bacterium]
MVAPILLGTLFGILQVGYDLFRDHLVSQSVQTAARMIQLGKVPPTAAAFRDAICASLATGLSCPSLFIDVRPVGSNYGQFLIESSGADLYSPFRYSLKLPSFDSDNLLCAGGPGDLIAIRAGYLATVISPLWPRSGYILVKGQRVRGLTATAIMRNEPTASVSWGPSC